MTPIARPNHPPVPIAELQVWTELAIDDVAVFDKGRNNRVFILSVGPERFVLNHYFRDQIDSRNRLGHEFGFLEYALAVGINCVPQPLKRDDARGLGLYQYLPGRPLKQEDIDGGLIQAAGQLLIDLNRHRHGDMAAALPMASEAAFSLHEALKIVERRLHCLGGIETADTVSRAAAAFVRGDLAYAWRDAVGFITATASGSAVDLDRCLAGWERCLSPSDFGFHNALIGSDGGVNFLDFEYAGWDDPVKAIADFVLQPEFVLPEGSLDHLVADWLAINEENQDFLIRLDLLLPVYRIKWCCIMLNEFLPLGAERRRHAGADSTDDRKMNQLGSVDEFTATI